MKDSNPQISLWRRAVCAISLIPHNTDSHFSKSNKKPGLSRVWCAMHKMHSDPQDTTPQMTRFVVILTMSRLKVLSIALRRFLCEFYCSTILERPAGFEPAYTSFVAKAIIPLWHGRMNWSGN